MSTTVHVKVDAAAYRNGIVTYDDVLKQAARQGLDLGKPHHDLPMPPRFDERTLTFAFHQEKLKPFMFCLECTRAAQEWNAWTGEKMTPQPPKEGKDFQKSAERRFEK